MTVSVSQYKFCTREISRLTTEKANTKGYTQNHYGISKCNSKKYSSNPHEKARKRTQNKKPHQKTKNKTADLKSNITKYINHKWPIHTN